MVAPCFSADEKYFACYDGKKSIIIVDVKHSWNEDAKIVAEVQVLGLPVGEYGSRMSYEPVGLRAFGVGVRAQRILAAIEYRTVSSITLRLPIIDSTLILAIDSSNDSGLCQLSTLPFRRISPN